MSAETMCYLTAADVFDRLTQALRAAPVAVVVDGIRLHYYRAAGTHYVPSHTIVFNDNGFKYILERYILNPVRFDAYNVSGSSHVTVDVTERFSCNLSVAISEFVRAAQKQIQPRLKPNV